MPTLPATASRSRPGHLAGDAFAGLHLLLVAALVLLNPLLFDWDAGMLAALVLVEALVVLLMLPLVWLALDRAWHRRRQRLAAAALAELRTQAQPDSAERTRLEADLGSFRWGRSLAGIIAVWLLVMGAGGLLPWVMLSAIDTQWPEWASGHAREALGIPTVLAVAGWPFWLAHGLVDEWPSFAWSLLGVAGLAAGQMLRLAWGALHADEDLHDHEEQAGQWIAYATVPLFMLAGFALGIGAWFERSREFSGVLAGQDVALWSMVALLVLRAAIGLLARVWRGAEHAWKRGDASQRRAADRAVLLTLGSTSVGLLLCLGLVWWLSEPRFVPATRSVDCVDQWPGEQQSATLAALTAQVSLPRDPQAACAQLGAARQLRLGARIAGEDLRWFQNVSRLALSGEGLAHREALEHLPALDTLVLALQPDQVLDARSLAFPPSLKQLVVEGGSIQHAEALWTLRGIDTLVLARTRIIDTEARGGRTRVRRLALSAVDGDLQAFLHGALGVEELRLTDQPLDPEAGARLLWLRRIPDSEGHDTGWFCPLIARMHRLQDRVRARCDAYTGAD